MKNNKISHFENFNQAISHFNSPGLLKHSFK